MKDAFGIKGELFVFSFSGDYSWKPKLKQFMLTKVSQIQSPQQSEVFTVESVRAHKNGLVIKALEIKDRNTSELWKGAEFLIDTKLLVSKPGEQIYLSEILDFEVIEQAQCSKLGKVVGISSNGAQDLLLISSGSLQFYLPFVEAFVKKIEYSQRKIYVEIPEGLIEVQQK